MILESYEYFVSNELSQNLTNTGSGQPRGFWLQAMLYCDTLKEIVQTHDLPILEYLKDIRITQLKP